MPTKIFSFFSIFVLLTACAPQAVMQAQPTLTNNLLQDLKAEGCCKNNFTPSAALIEKYELREDAKNYYIGGFLYVSASSKTADVEKLGVSVGTQIDSAWTVQVPVQNLEALLKTNGVKSFEPGRKVQIKKGGSILR